jgi:hypothetical protein
LGGGGGAPWNLAFYYQAPIWTTSTSTVVNPEGGGLLITVLFLYNDVQNLQSHLILTMSH